MKYQVKITSHLYDKYTIKLCGLNHWPRNWEF